MREYIDSAKLKIGTEYSDSIPIRPGANNVFYKDGTVEQKLDELDEGIKNSRIILNGDEYIKIVDGSGCGNLTIYKNATSTSGPYSLQFNRETRPATSGSGETLWGLVKLGNNTDFQVPSSSTISLNGKMYLTSTQIIGDSNSEIRMNSAIPNKGDASDTTRYSSYRGNMMLLGYSGQSGDYGLQINQDGNFILKDKNFTSTADDHFSSFRMAMYTKQPYGKNIQEEILDDVVNFNRHNIFFGGSASGYAPWFPVDSKSDPSQLILVAGTQRKNASDSVLLNDPTRAVLSYDEKSQTSTYFAEGDQGGFAAILNATVNIMGNKNYVVGDPDGVKINIPKPMILTNKGFVFGGYNYKEEKDDNLKSFYTTETVIHTGNLKDKIKTYCPVKNYSQDISSAAIEVQSLTADNWDLPSKCGRAFRIPEEGVYYISVANTGSISDSAITLTNYRLRLAYTSDTNSFAGVTSTTIQSVEGANGDRLFISQMQAFNKNDIVTINLRPTLADESKITNVTASYRGCAIKLVKIADRQESTTSINNTVINEGVINPPIRY